MQMLRSRRRVTLDEIDIKILNSLSRNCRISYEKLSSEMGLTAKSIKARVKKMRDDSIIDNFVVKINLRVLDYTRF
jgi:DNA-binding Lrp family transcriptional regulator